MVEEAKFIKKLSNIKMQMSYSKLNKIQVWNKNEIHLDCLNPRLNKIYGDPEREKDNRVYGKKK
jgi:hypothetical protein